MLKKILSVLRGCLGYLLVAINTAVTFIFFLPVALVKKFISHKKTTQYCLLYLHNVGKIWIWNNYLIVSILSRIKWQVIGLERIKKLPKDSWYLLISNHQSWNDVLILQFLFNKYLPFQKYLVKDKMRQFPVMGFVWESIDCPFLQRSTEKNQDSNKDIEIIKHKCAKFKLAPATITAFPEGTRFSKLKRDQQQSPHQYILKPKVGGIAAILEELHNEIRGMVDVSLHYHPGRYSFWDLFAGNIHKITAKINFIDIPDWLLEKYKNKIKYENYKVEFYEWIDSVWQQKDDFMVSQMHIEKTS